MQILFSFTFNTKTNEATVAGNVEPQLALNILQGIVVAAMVAKRQNDGHHTPEIAATKPEGGG